jgi:hypothetical protein
MWIINDRATSRHFNDELMDEPVEYNDNGTAQVTDDLGERLVEHYESIRPYEAGDAEAET